MPIAKTRRFSLNRRIMLRQILFRWDLYVMMIPPLIWYIIFRYGPMYGVQIAFKDFNPFIGIVRSPWIGFEHFERFFNSYYFGRLITNTLAISVYQLIIGFPIPIFLALLVNEIRNTYYKKLLQNVTYIPHFISVVVVVGMLDLFLQPQGGIVNTFLGLFGIEPIAFMEEARWFRTVYISSNIWQNMGWQSIIYIAALSGIDPQLYEAAKIDGASRWQRIRHVSIPGIFPTIVILLILRVGHIMNVGFEKILLMQNSLNMEASDVISTFVYRNGILQGDYSYSAAIGLFNSVINFILLLLINRYARSKAQTSLW